MARDSLLMIAMAARCVRVVEDDADVRGMVADYLRRSCPDVREASDGAEALALLTGSPEMAPEGGTVFPKPAKLRALRDFVVSDLDASRT